LSLWAKLGIAGLGVLVLPGLALVVIAQVLR
jgi:hypothetical protein